MANSLLSTVQFLLQTLLNPNFVGTISDTTQNIVSNLSALNAVAPQIASITPTNGTVTVTTSALQADSAVIGKITGGVGVSDTVANITSNLGAILGNNNVVSVSGTNGQISIGVAAFKANQSGLNKITGGLIVYDTAANISQGLDTLAGDPLMLTITISDNAPIVLNASQITSDAAAISKLNNANSSPYVLTVKDTAANIGSAIDTLSSANIGSIVVTDNGLVPVTVAQAINDGTAIGKMVDADGSSTWLALVDTAANIAAAPSLQSMHNIASIMVTGGGSATDVNAFALNSASTLNLGTSTFTVSSATTLGSTSTATPTITGSAGSYFVTNGTTTVGNLILGGAAVWQNTGTVTQTGNVQIGDASGTLTRIANRSGGNYNLIGDVSILAGSNPNDNFNANGGTLTKVSGTGVSYVYASFQDGNAAAAAIKVNSGSLQFVGAKNLFYAQSIQGAGNFNIGGAGVNIIGSGTTISTAGFQIARFGTTVQLNENLTYAGTYTQINATKLTLAPGTTFTLTGPSNFQLGPGGSPILNGAGTVVNLGTSTIAGLVVGGTDLLRNVGTVTQTGDIQLGDATGAASQITNAVGGVWNLAGNSNIDLGAAPTAIFNNGGGSLIKSSGAGLSEIDPNITNLGTTAGKIEVAQGTLLLNGAISGLQNAVADANTMLVFGNTVASGTAFVFGPNSALQLANSQGFHGTIAGFTGGDVMKLQDISGAGARLSYAGNTSGGTLTVTDGSHTSALSMIGNYKTSNFQTFTDQNGGTTVGFTLPVS